MHLLPNSLTNIQVAFSYTFADFHPTTQTTSGVSDVYAFPWNHLQCIGNAVRAAAESQDGSLGGVGEAPRASSWKDLGWYKLHVQSSRPYQGAMGEEISHMAFYTNAQFGRVSVVALVGALLRPVVWLGGRINVGGC